MASLVDCLICLDPPQEPRTSLLCGHEYCQSCLTEYLTALITDGATALKCCLPECKEPIQDWILESLLTREVYDKFDTFRLNLSLQELTIFYCPNTECKNAVSLESNDVKKVVCPSCKQAFCFQCRCLWHRTTRPVVGGSEEKVDQSCEDYQKSMSEAKNDSKDADRLAFEFVKKLGSKQCPRCRSWIEKAGGCEHVHCAACDLHFWWTTMKPLRKGYKLNDKIIAPQAAGLAPTEFAELPPPDDSSDNEDDGRGAGIAPGSERFRRGINKGGGGSWAQMKTEEELHAEALLELREKIRKARRERAEEAGVLAEFEAGVKPTVTPLPAGSAYHPPITKPFTRINLLLQSNATLSQLCKDYKLPSSGTKNVLVGRLLSLP